MMKAFLLIGIYCGFLYAEAHKLVFDLQTGNSTVIQKKFIDQVKDLEEYYEGRGDKLDVKVLVSGNSYKFFLKSAKNTLYNLDKKFSNKHRYIQKELAYLDSMYNVEFDICEKGFLNRKLNRDNLLEFLEIEHSHNTGLIKWQGKAYVVLSVK